MHANKAQSARTLNSSLIRVHGETYRWDGTSEGLEKIFKTAWRGWDKETHCPLIYEVVENLSEERFGKQGPVQQVSFPQGKVYWFSTDPHEWC